VKGGDRRARQIDVIAASRIDITSAASEAELRAIFAAGLKGRQKDHA